MSEKSPVPFYCGRKTFSTFSVERWNLMLAFSKGAVSLFTVKPKDGDFRLPTMERVLVRLIVD